jgi:hypothetical protein
MLDAHRKPLFIPPWHSGGDVSESNQAHQDRALDEALMESFPASDPVAVSVDYAVSQVRLGTEASER